MNVHERVLHGRQTDQSQISCRLIGCIRLLSRECLPHPGWTEKEVDMMKYHINHVWFPATKQLVEKVHKPAEVPKVLKVFKTHMVLAHSTDRMLDLGALQV